MNDEVSSIPLLQEEQTEEDEKIAQKSCAQSSKYPFRPRHYQQSCVTVMVVCIFLVAVSIALLSTRTKAINEAGQPLRFAADGTFQISIFEDLHYGENEYTQWGPQQDIWSAYVMNQVLDAESPDLVVLNGDLITGENTYLENSTDYVDRIVAPLVQRDLTWASTYGNHDSDFNLSRENILGHERLYLQARTTQMVFDPLAGVSNYYLPVYPSNGSDVPSLIVWFFDSRGGYYYQQQDEDGDLIGQPDWVDQSVVDWFKTTSQSLTKQHQTTIPSIGFVHIPTNASRALQTRAGTHPHHQPGINDDYPLAQQGQGWCKDGSNGDSCKYGEQDVPFMEAITSTPGFMALFSGHDHGDTWCYQWDDQLPGQSINGNGIFLCFGQHSGYGGYGTWTRGSRQILIDEKRLIDREMETWIRLETQKVVGAVTLNETYNRDWYPATKDTHTHCPTCD